MTDTDEKRLLTVGCPHCSSRYRLPLPLMGPGGARIHCPTCWESFVVSPDGVSSPDFGDAEGASFSAGDAPTQEHAEPTIPEMEAESSANLDVPAMEPGPSSKFEEQALDPEPSSNFEERALGPESSSHLEACSEEVIARAVVEELTPHAHSMREAQARGRLLAEAGPLLLEAFDAYRRRAGPGAGIAAFHDALSASVGIELPFALESGLPKRRSGDRR